MYKSHHVHDFEVSKREGDGVGGRGHRQHEGQRGSDGAGQHHIQRVYLNRRGLKNTTQLNTWKRKVCVNAYVCACGHQFTIEASMGRNRVVVAVLLEHSVNVATSKQSSNEMA